MNESFNILFSGFDREFLLADLHVILQGIIALVLGGLIGWEREAEGKWAGLRTHMLVCLAAMMFIKIGYFLVLDYERDLAVASLRMDPVRVIEAIVTGVAFLGAGTIFRDREAQSMRGLTTAASLLAVAPIGIAIAVERYVFAVGATCLVLLVLHSLRKLETRAHVMRTKRKDQGEDAKIYSAPERSEERKKL